MQHGREALPTTLTPKVCGGDRKFEAAERILNETFSGRWKSFQVKQLHLSAIEMFQATFCLTHEQTRRRSYFELLDLLKFSCWVMQYLPSDVLHLFQVEELFGNFHMLWTIRRNKLFLRGFSKFSISSKPFENYWNRYSIQIFDLVITGIYWTPSTMQINYCLARKVLREHDTKRSTPHRLSCPDLGVDFQLCFSLPLSEWYLKLQKVTFA